MRTTVPKITVNKLKNSILFNILYLICCIPWPATSRRKRGRPYVYSPTVILRCFIVRIWFRIDSNNGLHTFLIMDCCQYNTKLAVACGLVTIPSKRTFDRRLKTMSTDIKEKISTMGYLFAAIEGIADPSITAIDSTLLKQKVLYGINHQWRKEKYLVLVLTRMHGVDTAIPRDGYLDTNYI